MPKPSKTPPAAPATEDALARLTRLARLAHQQQAAVEAAEVELRAAKDNLLRTQRLDLPELMKELGLERITLAGGTEIECKPELDAAIQRGAEAEAHAWLTKHGYGGLIRTTVKITFGAQDEEPAYKLLARLHDEDLPAEYEQKIPPQTLKAWAKERIAAGENLPPALFKLSPYDWAKITLPK